MSVRVSLLMTLPRPSRYADLVRSAAANDAATLRDAVQSIAADVRALTRACCARETLPLDVSADDLAQEVLETLLEPKRAPSSAESTNAEATVRAWIRITVRRRVIDLSRARRDRPAAPRGEDREERDIPDESPAADCRADARARFEAARRAIAAYHARGLPLFDLESRDPELTSADYSQRLGTSIANVDQLRRRNRLAIARADVEALAPYAAAVFDLWVSRPGITPLEIASATGLTRDAVLRAMSRIREALADGVSGHAVLDRAPFATPGRTA
jgi:DNA-directed RNA polymerase specialized sigma24 family protein